jgi:hypothetical protein
MDASNLDPSSANSIAALNFDNPKRLRPDCKRDKTLQCEKKLKIFKKCVVNLRFMDTLLGAVSSFSAISAFYILNLNSHTAGTSWISDYLNTSKHRGSRSDRLF